MAQSMIAQAKRLVVKVGTSTLTYENGRLNIRRIEALVKVLSDIRNSGREVLLVSSGAIGVGAGHLGLKERPRDVEGKQAAAAVGQCELMYTYDKLFAEYGYVTAQVLLTRDVVEEDTRKKNAVNTLCRLLEYGALPIINENDTVAVEEIEFGDNDTLSAIVARLCGAGLLVLFSDIDGLYDADPRTHPDARLIHQVEAITPELRAMAGGAGTWRGTGGMATKLNAAQLCLEAGVDMVIANGARMEALYDIVEGKNVGTRFSARRGALQ